VKSSAPISINSLPAVTVTELDDPTSAGTDIELIDLDVVQLGAVPFRARRVVVRLEGAAAVFHSTNVRVRTHTSVSSGLIAYVTFGPHAKGTVNGLPVRPGMVLAAEPGTEARFVVDAGWESITFLLPTQEVSEHLTSRQRESDFRLPHGVEALRVNEESGRALFNWGKRLVSLAARQPDLFNTHRQERIAARAELLETLLATLGGAVDLEPAGDERTRTAQSLVVKTVESYALSRIDEQLQVSDLCRAAGVSERTLEYAFRETMGLTPVTYLIRLRLHQVRRALLAATQGSTTVSAVALDWGFWHFGDFSRAYRECFGELPSDTLRREPEAPGGRHQTAPPRE
jgi:AraC family transcriptional regulator, ethanolamine operon transcriptional activator